MKLSEKIFSRKRRLLLSAVPTFFSINSFASSLKRNIKRPLQIIFPIPYAGSINREIPMKMFDGTGIDYFFENKFGASGLIATKYFEEDKSGSVMMVATNTIMLTNFIQHSDKLSSGMEGVFKCIGAIYKVPFVMVTKKGSQLDTSYKKFIESIKINKKGNTYSITGYYDIPHLCGEQLSTLTGSKLLSVPYKTNYLAPVITGEVDFSFTTLSAALPYVVSSNLSVIAHTSDLNQKLIPNATSLTRIDGFEPIEAVYGLVSSKSMSDELLNDINGALNQVLSNEAYRETQAQLGITLFRPNRPSDYLKYLRNERKKYEMIMNSIRPNQL